MQKKRKNKNYNKKSRKSNFNASINKKAEIEPDILSDFIKRQNNSKNNLNFLNFNLILITLVIIIVIVFSGISIYNYINNLKNNSNNTISNSLSNSLENNITDINNIPSHSINNTNLNNFSNETHNSGTSGGRSSGGGSGGSESGGTIPVVDTTYPLFSNYFDNNGTLINSGIGIFNISILNTNGNVILEISGANYTATNLGNNIYQTSINFFSNGTYFYKWHSWGNGPSNNYNSSETKSYFISYDSSIPRFSLYSDNSPINLSQIAQFNVTVQNTNGSVYININGENYKASNLSSNVYNVSINFSSPGVYSYYWYSYGNGSYHVYNNSPARDLYVNFDSYSISSQLLPLDNAWNQPVDNAMVDSNRTGYFQSLYSGTSLHPDFGTIYGIPFNVVLGNQPLVDVVIDAYPEESDIMKVPIPDNAIIEGDIAPGVGSGSGDRHLLVFDQTNQTLYEIYATTRPSENDDGKWHGDGETVWHMDKNELRYPGWTSVDAAGLAVLPGLVRADEVIDRGEVNHAFRFTLQNTRHVWVYPATHRAGLWGSTVMPMGTRIRLKAGFNITGYSESNQVILRALKKYGMILADNGGSMFFSGALSSRWDDEDLNNLKNLKGSDFEVVNMTPVVNEINPLSGSVNGGTQVTINGLNFLGSNGLIWVNFNDIPAESINVINETQIIATAPAYESVEIVNISVHTPYGLSPVSSKYNFTFTGTPNSSQDFFNGLIGYWNFDSDPVRVAMIDLSIGNHHGYITSGTQVILSDIIPETHNQNLHSLNLSNNSFLMMHDSYRMGPADYAGSTRQVSIDNQGTINAWINYAIPGTIYGETDSRGYSVRCRLSNKSNSIRLDLYVASPNGDNEIYGSTVLQPETWYNIACSSNGTKWKLYVNGQPENLTLSSGSVNNGDWFADILPPEGWVGTSSIGANDGGWGYSGEFFTGLIDEVQVYNRALNDSEISLIGTAGSGVEIESEKLGFLRSLYNRYQIFENRVTGFFIKI